MHLKNEFKNNEVLVKFLFKTLLRNNIKTYPFSIAEGSDSQLGILLHTALLQLNEEEQRIITEEFIHHKQGDWWVYYYSRATYYRLKGQAMKKLIDYLNKGKII
jgi:hypothetical protein